MDQLQVPLSFEKSNVYCHKTSLPPPGREKNYKYLEERVLVSSVKYNNFQ